MKNRNAVLMMSLSLLALTLPGIASAEKEAGGIPPAPRAVVVQEHSEGTNYNEKIATAVRATLSQEIAAGENVIAFREEEDDVIDGRGRRRWCIEYRSYDAFQQGRDNFKQSLSGFARTEVVQGGRCK